MDPALARRVIATIEAEPNRSFKNLCKRICAEHLIPQAEAEELARQYRKGGKEALVSWTRPDDVLQILRRELRWRRVSKQIFLWSAILFSCVLLMEFVQTRQLDFTRLMLALSMFFGLSTALSVRHKMALYAADAQKDKRVISALLESLDTSEPRIRKLATRAIENVAIKLEEGDGQLLLPRHRESLLSLAVKTREPTLALAIVAAIGRMRLQELLPGLERIAQDECSLADPRDRAELASAARMAMADIRLHLARERILEEEELVTARRELDERKQCNQRKNSKAAAARCLKLG